MEPHSVPSVATMALPTLPACEAVLPEGRGTMVGGSLDRNSYCTYIGARAGAWG